MKKFLLLTALIIFSIPAFSQIYEIDNLNGQSINTCSGTFYDSGGQFSDYGTNENYTVTFCPATGSQGFLVNFNSINIGTGDQLCIHDGPTTAANITSCLNSSTVGSPSFGASSSNTSGCLTFQFTSDFNVATIGAGWEATFSCLVNCQSITAKVLTASPAIIPADTGYIDICEGESVTLTGTGLYPQNNTFYTQSDATSTFEWIIEGQILTGQTITHVFNDAGGYRAQLTVTDINGCSSTNSVNQRIRVAPEPSFAGTSVSDTTACIGDTITLFGNVIPATQNFATRLTRGDSIFLPDGNGVCYQTVLNFADFNPGQTLTNVNDLLGICVNMEHSFVGDLDISITCPNGNSVVLVPNPNSGGGLNVGIPVTFGAGPGTGFDYCWTPTAPFTWSQAQANGLIINTGGFNTAIKPGDYRSSQSLAGLVGCPLNGQWTLEICDNIPIDDGYVFSWEIALDPLLYPALDTFTPSFVSSQWQVDTGIVALDTFSYVITSSGTSTFTYSATNEFGCTFDTTITVVSDIPPIQPMLACGTTNASSITVSRSNVTGAAGYEINVDNGGWQSFPSTNFTVSNLQELQAVQFQLRAVGSGACNEPSSIDTLVCMTADCQLFANLDSITPVSCNGLSDGIVYVSATTNVSPITYALDNGIPQSSGTFAGLSIGNHFIIIKDANTCEDTINFTVTEPTILASTISMTEVLCTGESNGTATVNPSGATMPYSYQWDNNAGNQTTATASNLAIGTYNVTVTDANTCQTTNQITVTEPTALMVAMDKKDANCFQENTGYAVALPSGGVGGYTYSSDANASNQTTDTAYNLGIGTYSVTVTDLNNCTISNTVTLSEPVILDISADTNRVSCFGASDGEAITTTTGGTFPYQYFWNITNDTTPTADTLSGGFHTVMVTDSNGCKDSITVGIYEPPMINLTFSTTQVTCFGLSDGTATVSPSGGIGTNYTYYWNNPANNQITPTAINLVGGVVEVIVRDEENCPQQGEVLVIAPPLVFIDTMTSTPTLCYGSNEGTVSTSGFGGSGNLIYAWSNGGNGNTQTNLYAGEYQVTITDNFGCQAIDSIDVERPDSIEFAFTPTQLLCNGDGTGAASASVIGGTFPYLYSWFNANPNPSVNNLQSGTYALTVTDANNCIQVDSVFVSEPTLLTATATFVAPLCFGDTNGSATIIASGGNGGNSFSWNTSPIQNDTTAVGLASGIYTYSVTDSNNCVFQNTINVSQPDALVLQMSSVSVLCRDSANGIAIATPIGGSYPFNYGWNGFVNNDSILSPLDTGNYVVTATDAFGCMATDSVTVSQPTYITSSLSKTDLSCFESGDGTATVAANGGVGTYNYIWSSGSQTSTTALGLNAGFAAVTITDANNCPKQDSILITQPTEVITTVSSTLADCFGANTGTVTALATGGVGNITYIWNTSPMQTGSVISNLLAGDYIVTATDFTGCSDIDTITVGEPTALIIAVSKTDMTCFDLPNGTASVVGNGGTVTTDYSYLWSNNGATDSISGLTNITYSVSVTDDNGCVTVDSVTIVEPPILASTITQLPASCFESSDAQAMITVNGGTPDSLNAYNYSWNTIPMQLNDTAINLTGGSTYIATIIDFNNCIHTDTVTIQHPDVLVLSNSTTNTTCDYTDDGTGTITAVGGTMPYSYNWSDSQITQTAINLLKGNYQTTVTDNNGCVQTINVIIDGPSPILIDAMSVSALCKGDANGSLLASASGGTPIGVADYTYLWSDNQADSLAQNLIAGLYQVTATDANGCIGVDSFEVNEPKFDLFPNITVTDVSCFGDQNGLIRINPIGGTAPYRFSTDNQTYSLVNNISGLEPDTYIYFVKDKNNCVESDTVEILEPLPFTVFLPTDTTITYPDEVTITPVLQNGFAPFTYLWESQDSVVDCPNCIELTTSIEGLRYLTVVDSNGCEATATVFISVDKNIEIFVASGFSPNNDGTNDWLFVQGDDQVVMVKSFLVYDRWGEKVFDVKDTAPNEASLGWDGNFGGQPANTGIYGWVLEVELSDGSIQVLKGNTTLFR